MTQKLIYSIIIITALCCAFLSGRYEGKQETWVACSEAYKSKCAINDNMSRLLGKEIGK